MTDSSSGSGSRPIADHSPYTGALREKAVELVGRYPHSRSALLPLLHLVQHVEGHITDDGVALCAELLDLTRAEVGAVATFFTMYKREPLGEHLVSVCTNFSCHVRGAGEVYRRLADKLGVGHNETTADGRFTLEHAECLGNCEGAPVVTVDYLNYECQTPESAEGLLDRIAGGERPLPTRGFAPEGVRAVSHRLAGLGPADGAGVADAGHASDQARAGDGGLPPVDAGPGLEPVVIEPTFSERSERERAEAKQAVRDAGADPDEVEAGAGPAAREFPTVDPDWEPREPTPRSQEQVEPGPASRTPEAEQEQEPGAPGDEDEERGDG